MTMGHPIRLGRSSKVFISLIPYSVDLSSLGIVAIRRLYFSGLHKAAEFADLIASMDADLQDDINALDEMVSRAREGYEVVYGVRK